MNEVAFFATCTTAIGTTGILFVRRVVAFFAAWKTVLGAFKTTAPTVPVMGAVKFFAVPNTAFGAERINCDTGLDTIGEVKFVAAWKTFFRKPKGMTKQLVLF